MTQTKKSEDSGEGSLNRIKDGNGNADDNVKSNTVLNECTESTKTTAECIQSTSISDFSVYSDSSLLVPGKLYNDIAKLKSC